MATTLVKTIADFSTTLVTKTAVGATSATLTSATDADGVALPTGTYAFTIDRSSSTKEYFTATLTGTALTNIKRVTRGTGLGTAGLAYIHRKGAEIIISDHVAIKRMMNLLDGTDTFDASTPLGYDGTATISNLNHLATKAYVDGVAIAGAPDSTTSTKGIGRVSVAPVAPATPIFVGDNDGRVSTQGENDAQVGNNIDIAVGTGNKFVTQTGTQKNTEKYAADGSASSTAYTITLAPVPTSYTTGMVVHVKIGLANTTAAPTINVNSLGAKTIVKGVSTALAVSDIAANMFCTLIYDGTNFVLQNPIANLLVTTYTNGATTKNSADASTTQNIAHGLGKTPKVVRIIAIPQSVITQPNQAITVYNGTTQSSKAMLCNGGGLCEAYLSFSLATNDPRFGVHQSGILTFDATNIIITWTKNSSPTGVYDLVWEAQA